MSSSTQTRGERQDDLIGQTVSGRYRIEQLLAVGGMAQVYLAEHIHIRKLVAIKVLRPDAEGFRELTARFEREAIAGAHINHPNVAGATDFGYLLDGSAFVAMEFVEGVTLRHLIARGPMSPVRAAAITRQIASALQACHELGVVHRDLKPGNVMVTEPLPGAWGVPTEPREEGRGDVVKLIDFGLARVPVERVSMRSSASIPPPPPGSAVSARSVRITRPPESFEEHPDEPTLRNLTCKGIVFGTVTYMAPEIALGMDAIDARSDLYALGVMLYEMLSGKAPFDMREPAELLLTRRTTTAPPIAARAPGVVVPAALEAVAARLLSPSPRARYQTARETVLALDAAMAAPPVVEVASEPSFRASSTLKVLPAVMTSAQHLVGAPKKRLGAVAAALLALGVGLLGIWGFHENLLEQTALATPIEAADPGIGPVVEALRSQVKPPPAAPASGKPSVVTLRKRFNDAHKIGSWLRAGKTLIDIADVDPTELADPKLVKKAAVVAVQLDYSDGGTGTKLFEALAYRAGAPGHDLLYEVLSGKGGSAAADRATALLAEPAVRATIAPELVVSLELRDRRCKDKPQLFERAGKEGDERTLVYLRQIRAPRCDARRGECCFHGNKKLSAAIDTLEKRPKSQGNQGTRN
jgi:eukaryotic-like serine/threonine-protein kinase